MDNNNNKNEDNNKNHTSSINSSNFSKFVSNSLKLASTDTAKLFHKSFKVIKSFNVKLLIYDYDDDNNKYIFNPILLLIIIAIVFVSLSILFINPSSLYDHQKYNRFVHSYKVKEIRTEYLKNNSNNKDTFINKLLDTHKNTPVNPNIKSSSITNNIINTNSNTSLIDQDIFPIYINKYPLLKHSLSYTLSIEKEYVYLSNPAIIHSNNNNHNKIYYTNFSPSIGNTISLSLKFHLTTSYNEPIIASPSDPKYVFPNNTNFYGYVAGYFNNKYLLYFTSYSINNSNHNIKAIAVYDDKMSLFTDPYISNYTYFPDISIFNSADSYNISLNILNSINSNTYIPNIIIKKGSSFDVIIIP